MDRGEALRKGVIRSQQCSPSVSMTSWLGSQCTRAKGRLEGRGHRLTSESQGNVEKRSHFRKRAQGSRLEERDSNEVRDSPWIQEAAGGVRVGMTRAQEKLISVDETETRPSWGSHHLTAPGWNWHLCRVHSPM